MLQQMSASRCTAWPSSDLFHWMLATSLQGPLSAGLPVVLAGWRCRFWLLFDATCMTLQLPSPVLKITVSMLSLYVRARPVWTTKRLVNEPMLGSFCSHLIGLFFALELHLMRCLLSLLSFFSLSSRVCLFAACMCWTQAGAQQRCMSMLVMGAEMQESWSADTASLDLLRPGFC